MKKIRALLSNPVARNSGIMFVGTMAVNLGAYLYQVVVLRIMGPSQYSELAALFSILFLISVPAQVAQTVLTKLFAERKASKDLAGAKSLFLLMMKYLSITSAVGFVIFLPLIPLLQSALKIQSFSSFLGLYGIFITVFLITGCMSVLNGFQKFLPSTFFMTLMMLLRLLSGLLFATKGVALTVISNAVANIVALGLFFLPLRFLLKEKTKSYHFPKREIFFYAVPTLLVLLAITMLYNLDVVLVKMFFASEIAGIYGGLTVFGKIIFFAASAILLAVFPMVAERKALGSAYKQLVLAGLGGVVLMSIAIVALYFFLAPWVTQLLFGPKFSGVVPYLGWFGIFMMMVTIINYLGTISLAVNKTGIWKVIMSGALIQIAAIVVWHQTLMQVIIVNSVVAAIIAIAAYLYYIHEPKTT